MANRNYNPVRGAGYELEHLAGSFQPNGVNGAQPVNNGAGWFTVTRTGAGLYTLNLQDGFFGIYSANMYVTSPGAQPVYLAIITPPSGTSLQTLLQTAPVAIPFVTYAQTGSTLPGVVADPTINNAASTVFFNLLMKNSTVPG